MLSTETILKVNTLVLALLFTTAVDPAAGQSPTTASSRPGVAFELRLGALWPQPPLIFDRDESAPSTSSFAVGGRFGYNFAGPLGGRLGLHLLGDYAQLGSTEYTEAGLGLVRREGHWFVFTPAISVDLVKTSRIVAGARVGPSIVGELTTFLLERSSSSCTSVGGTVSCEGPFENVCDLTAFENRCAERYRAALALGGAVRWHQHRSWPLYVGVDYTWLTIDRNVLVGTIGLATRN